MKRLSVVALVMGVSIALFPKSGFSNAAEPEPPGPPPREPNKPVPFKITADGKTTENRLVIPRKFLENSGAGAVGFLGDGDGGTNLRTIIAGVAISLSLASLVFLLIRRKSRLAQAMALFVAVSGAGLIWVDQAKADIPPPISEIPQAWRRVGPNQQNVTIEIAENGEAVELIVGTYRKRSLPPQERPEPVPPPKSGSAPKGDGSAPK